MKKISILILLVSSIVYASENKYCLTFQVPTFVIFPLGVTVGMKFHFVEPRLFIPLVDKDFSGGAAGVRFYPLEIDKKAYFAVDLGIFMSRDEDKDYRDEDENDDYRFLMGIGVGYKKSTARGFVGIELEALFVNVPNNNGGGLLIFNLGGGIYLK